MHAFHTYIANCLKRNLFSRLFLRFAFQETKAVHVCVDSGSYIRVYQPWTVNEYGYTTSVVAKLLQVEATTGLEYRSLFEADSLDVSETCRLYIMFSCLSVA